MYMKMYINVHFHEKSLFVGISNNYYFNVLVIIYYSWIFQKIKPD